MLGEKDGGELEVGLAGELAWYIDSVGTLSVSLGGVEAAAVAEEVMAVAAAMVAEELALAVLASSL